MTKKYTFNLGDKVLRRRDKNFIQIGEITAIAPKTGKARVAWEHQKMNGSGVYATTVSLSDLEPVTESALAIRQVNFWQSRVNHYRKYPAMTNELVKAQTKLSIAQSQLEATKLKTD